MAAIKYILKKIAGRLPALDAELLLAHSLNRSREFLYTHPEYKLSLLERLRLAYFLFLYKRGYSVAAITHHKEFYGLDFYVNKHTLIPRPETEVLVEETLQEINKTIKQKITLIDVGTGSGCIPIAIAKHFNCHPERSEGSLSAGQLDRDSSVAATLPQNDNLKIFATDISRPALRVAQKNAERHNVNITFLHGNLFKPFVSTYSLLPTPYNLIITANLPYLTQAQFDSEYSIHREPRSALIANNGGLALYEQLLKQVQSLLVIGHWSLVIFLEIDPSQASRVTNLIKKYVPTAVIEIKPDLASRDRIIKIVIPT